MYKCNECDHVFDEPKKYVEDRTPGEVFEGGAFIYSYEGCPLCGGNYDEYNDYNDEEEKEEE